MVKFLNQAELDDVQGNIIKGHGREHVRCLFLQFGNNPERLNGWLSRFSPIVTSALQQERVGEKRAVDDSVTQVGLYLSASGYLKLGFTFDQMPEDLRFRLGMKDGQVNGALGDPAVVNWEPHYQRSIDAMILLANKYESKLNFGLEPALAVILSELESTGAGRCIFIENGRVQPNGSRASEAVEHFGYRDGISNPDVIDEKDGVAFDSNMGSYLVYRKLEQNVLAFHNEINRIAKALDLDPKNQDDLEFVRAQVIGRFTNGDQLDLAAAGFRANQDYGFDSSEDRCPFHAHIRKTRGGVEGVPDIRIVRRGITYGNRLPNLSDKPESGVGLLFMCFQSSIAGQFEHLQKAWCNRKDFISPKPVAQEMTGVDPIVGWQLTTSTQRWRRKPGQGDPVKRQFHQVITLKGGEYFYSPPKSFFMNPKPPAHDNQPPGRDVRYPLSVLRPLPRIYYR